MRTYLLKPVAISIALLLCVSVCFANTPVMFQFQGKNWRNNKNFRLSEKAGINLQMVREIGATYGDHAPILQAIAIQETKSGDGGMIGSLNRSFIDRSYGLMQVQINTARDVFRRFPELLQQFFPSRKLNNISNKEIADLLLKNNTANIHIASAVFTLYYNMLNYNLDKTIAAYNMGIGKALKRKNANKSIYVSDVKNNLKHIVEPFNDQVDNLSNNKGEQYEKTEATITEEESECSICRSERVEEIEDAYRSPDPILSTN